MSLSAHDKVEMLRVQERLMDNLLKQVDLLGDLRTGLLQQWAKEDGISMNEITHAGYLVMLKDYHKAVEKDHEWVTMCGSVLLTGLAEYLLPMIEKRLLKDGRCPFGWAQKVNMLKRDHKVRITQKGKS